MRDERNHEPRTRHSTNASSSHTRSSSSPHTNGSGSHGKSNGTDTETNGYHHTNGHTSSAPTLPSNTEPFYGHDREEVTRILLQGLKDLGYHQAAQQLSDDSGHALEVPGVAAFRHAVLSGEWEEAELLLFGSEDIDGGVMLGNGHNTTASSAWTRNRLSLSSSQNGFTRHGLPLAEGADITALKFLIRQQKYLELLENRNLNAALFVLRNELTPLKRDILRLHALSGLMMAPTTASLLAQASWDGSTGASRSQLLSDLSRQISPSVMIPEHRLATLLTTLQNEQILGCRYHNTVTPPSLYTEHECFADDFPLQPFSELRQHTDEVWFLEFSHDGSMLASAGKDGSVCVYETAQWSLRHQFKEPDHRLAPGERERDKGVCYIAFSPDDQYLISCSQNNEFVVMNVRDGRCVSRGDHFDYPVTCAAWLPDSQTFVVGSQTSRRPLSLYSLRPSAGASSSASGSNGVVKNNEIYSFREPPWDTTAKEQQNSFRVSDVAVSPSGHRLAVTTTDDQILIYNLPARQRIAQWQMEGKLTSINFDSKGEEILVNMQNGRVLLLSAEAGESRMAGEPGEMEVKCRYEGVVQQDFALRSCFGGAGQGIVASGSEDSRVYIWRRQTGMQIAALDAHAPGTVNAVAWHPTDPAIFASAGDDRKVRIWAPASSMRPPSAGTTSGAGASRTSLGLYSSLFAGR